MEKKWDRSAMRFVSAKYVPQQGMLDVTFENGDHFLVAAESVVPAVDSSAIRRSGSRAGNVTAPSVPPEWTKMRISQTRDVLQVPAMDSVIEIPWDRIRSIADPAFRAHLADRAYERARRVGGRIQTLRIEAGLSRVALAEKLGVPRQTVANLEAGKIEPQLDLIEEIAFALGKRLRDFAED